MDDISGFGTRLVVKASNTFPVGFEVSNFADDANPIDIPGIEISGSAMGLNGNLITWNTANPLLATINVVPNSEEDLNLALVGESNRSSIGKLPARDVITVFVAYPDGSTLTLKSGKMQNYMPGKGVASSGRYVTKAYQFVFEDLDSTPPTI